MGSSSKHFLLGLGLVWAGATLAQALTDGTTSAIEAGVRPGAVDLIGQQNLWPWLAMDAGYARESYNNFVYYGWTLGTSWRIRQWLGDDWRALASATFGLTGLQGEGHGHFAFFTGSGLEWESRHLLGALRVNWQRGTAMPDLAEGEARAGYSPFAPSMTGVPQPWVVLSYLGRSGSGEARVYALARLLAVDWTLEFGASVPTAHPLLELSVAL